MVDPSAQSFLRSIRRGRTPISEQIRSAIRQAIADGRLPANSRLPSSRDLAIRLGVARGTVRSAFEQLAEEGVIVSGGAGGSWVREAADPMTAGPVSRRGTHAFRRPMEGLVPEFSGEPLPFQMGVPASDAFPLKAWRRLRIEALRRAGSGMACYADPRGEPELRSQIAGQLAIGRHLHCDRDQVIVTSGYRQGLALTLLALEVRGRKAWMEDPGFSIGRRALELAGVSVAPVPVDGEGMRVDVGIRRARDAALALVTPSQQAPLGVALSPQRRQLLMEWAASSGAWIVEDDYLSELQLEGRAAPALATGGDDCRVVHLGTFSKTLSPSLGLGFLVAPPLLVDRFTEMAAMLTPAPERHAQLALAEFMASGSYLRHLRGMKLLYRRRATLVRERLEAMGQAPILSGLAMLLRLPGGTDDGALAERALRDGIAPAPLSAWYADPQSAEKGLLLNVANLDEGNVDAANASLASALAEG